MKALGRISFWRCLSATVARCRPMTLPLIEAKSPYTPGIFRRTYATISAADLNFGQPVFETHPHLLRPGEVTPGITAQEYADRRARLAASLPDNAIAVLASSDLKYRSGPVFYEFHQDTDFLYLTGFCEDEAVAVIQKDSSSIDPIFHLFVRSKDEQLERWHGARSGQQAALDVFNADKTGDISQLRTLLPPLIDGASTIYAPAIDRPGLLSFFKKKTAAPTEFQTLLDGKEVKPIKPLMSDLRVVKSEAEIANMRTAGKISGQVFTNAMRRRWTTEKDLWAYLDYKFKTGGCETSAYVAVVAGGKNGHSIHYVQNNNVLANGECVLVDAGGQYGGYITDITRTWPVSGRFTQAQRDLYEAVLKVQRTSVSLCRESSNLNLDKLHEITESGLKDTLGQLGFDMSGNAIKLLYPHHTSHYIGLDIHDCPDYTRLQAPLRAGQCVTVEPGVYVPDDDRWPKHFRGLAVRIEDSVCVQEDHPLVLTTEAVKEVVDIEALRD